MLDRIWVRALVAVVTYLMYSMVLWLLGEFALVHGLAIGKGVLFFDFLSLFAAIIVGPAWIFHRVPRPPRGGGRKGVLVQLPVDNGRDDLGEPPIAA